MLPSVVEIDNLNRAGKMMLGQIPDPFGTIGCDDLLLCAAPATSPSFQIEPLAKLFGGLNGAGVGGGIRVADREAFLVPRGLSEHTSQLGFSRMGRLAVRLALSSHRLLSSPPALPFHPFAHTGWEPAHRR